MATDRRRSSSPRRTTADSSTDQPGADLRACVTGLGAWGAWTLMASRSGLEGEEDLLERRLGDLEVLDRVAGRRLDDRVEISERLERHAAAVDLELPDSLKTLELSVVDG
jgi:hypothetical protein